MPSRLRTTPSPGPLRGAALVLAAGALLSPCATQQAYAHQPRPALHGLVRPVDDPSRAGSLAGEGRAHPGRPDPAPSDPPPAPVLPVDPAVDDAATPSPAATPPGAEHPVTSEPALQVLPLGTGLILVGLGLGLAFVGLRVRRG